MPLPADISHADLTLSYKFKSIEIRDERTSIDSSDLITPKVSFTKKLIKVSPPLTNVHKDSLGFVLKKQLSNGQTEVNVTVHLLDSFKEFSTLPMEDKEKAKCLVKLKIDLEQDGNLKTCSATAEYFVTGKDVNDKGFEQLYIRTLKNSVQTCLNEFK